jgi:UDP-N-acetylglucosamine 4,6-dehydratase
MRILVTGGAGFFGQAFAKRILERDTFSQVCVYSRGEYAQATMRQSLSDPDGRMRYFIGDVRDQERLTIAMHGVDVVVHAAALKRIEVCATNVYECVATNVCGTEIVTKACLAAGVKKAILLNTDKAVNPTTTYGFSKALAERIFLGANHYAGAHGTRFASCLYGNIAGSTGSVIPTWRKSIAAGDMIVVTDPDATRFWMYASEAVDLVLNSLEQMNGGEVFTPDLPAYRVGDLARAMGAKEWEIIGLAKNEKAHEEMRLGETSDLARRMSIEEIRAALAQL